MKTTYKGWHIKTKELDVSGFPIEAWQAEAYAHIGDGVVVTITTNEGTPLNAVARARQCIDLFFQSTP